MQKCAAINDDVDDIPTETNVTTAVVKLKESLLKQLEKCEEGRRKETLY